MHYEYLRDNQLFSIYDAVYNKKTPTCSPNLNNFKNNNLIENKLFHRNNSSSLGHHDPKILNIEIEQNKEKKIKGYFFNLPQVRPQKQDSYYDIRP